MKIDLSKLKMVFCLCLTLSLFSSCDNAGMVSPPIENCIPLIKLNLPNHNYAQLIMTQTYRNDYTDTSWQRIFTFDALNRVKSEEYKDYNFSYTNYVSEFVYSEDNLLIEEIRSDTVYRTICWARESASYFDPLDEADFRLMFDDNRLIQINSGLNSVSYDYDLNTDTVSIDVNDEHRMDLIEFDENVLNPHYLLKSIGVIQYWNRYPFLENIHRVEKRYPFQELDVTYPLRYIDIEYFFDSQNRVSRMERDQYHIYAVHYKYVE